MGFDLTATARAYDRAGILPRRILMGAIGALGLGMLGAGTILSFPASTALQGRIVLPVLGLVLLAASAWGWSRLPKAAESLVVRGRALTLRRIDGREFTYDLSQTRTRVTIYDWRGVPRDARDRGVRGVEFVLVPGRGVEASIGLSEVEAILEASVLAGCAVTGWSKEPTEGQALVRISHS